MYFLALCLGIACVALLLYCQSGEKNERYRKYQRLLHAAVENFSVRPIQTAPLTYISALLGRESRKCDIPIGSGVDADKTVSRVHGLLEYYDGSWFLRPVRRKCERSLNGLLRYVRNAQGCTDIYVNESAIPLGPLGMPLRYGDTFRMGDQRLRLSYVKDNPYAVPYAPREKLKYALSTLLTALFLVLLTLCLNRYAPSETPCALNSCMRLIVAVFCGLQGLTIVFWERFHKFHCLAAAVTVLLGIGTAYQHILGNDGKSYLIHLTLFYAAAVVTAVVMRFFFWNPQDSFRSEWIFRGLLALCVLLMLANILFGRRVNGARLWVGPVQVGEVLKPLLILLSSLSYRNGKRTALYTAAALSAVLMLLFLKDFGNAVILFAVWWVTIFILMDSRLLNWSIAALAIVGFVILVSRFPHARDRVDQFFNVMDPNASAQLRQMMISIWFAGLRGLGLGNGRMITNIFAIETDMALAGVWAVGGFLLLGILVAAYAVVIRQAIQNYSVYPAAHLILTQASVLITCQVLLNLCGSLNVMPLTGVVSPLVSLGGSSMIATGVLIGMMEAAMNPKLPDGSAL